jgi:hypothetical protein
MDRVSQCNIVEQTAPKTWYRAPVLPLTQLCVIDPGAKYRDS